MSALNSLGEARNICCHSCVCKATACGEVCLDAIATHSPCRVWSTRWMLTIAVTPQSQAGLWFGDIHLVILLDPRRIPQISTSSLMGEGRFVAEVCVILILLALPLLTLLACSADPLWYHPQAASRTSVACHTRCTPSFSQ